MRKAIAEMMTSKKFVAAVISAVAWGVGHLGLGISSADLAPVVGPLWLYVVGQAVADVGKEKAKLEAPGEP